jgi:hypothetical protein
VFLVSILGGVALLSFFVGGGVEPQRRIRERRVSSEIARHKRRLKELQG